MSALRHHIRARSFGIICRAVLVLGLVPGIGCSLSTTTDPYASLRPGRRILFIGNSLTYFNNLPLIVEAMGDSAGQPPLSVVMVVFPDYSLEDHVANGAALAAINHGGWELVVLQQGSSALEASRIQLRQFTGIFGALIRQKGGRPALYMVWPSSDRQFDFDRVIESYTLAAADVDGLLIPVGAAWIAAWKRDATLPLYAADGLHPSAHGSYLAAAVMYARIYGKSPVGLPGQLRLRNGDIVAIPATQAALLQAAAAEVTGT